MLCAGKFSVMILLILVLQIKVRCNLSFSFLRCFIHLESKILIITPPAFRRFVLTNKIMSPKKIIISCIAVIILYTNAFAQSKDQYKVACIGFYNLENFYDTINQPDVQDDEFTPGGAKNYTPAVYFDKIQQLTKVLSQIATDVSPDGLSMFGCAEIENESVLKDLIQQPEFKNRNYAVVHYDSPDLRGIDVGLIYNPKYFKVKHSEPVFVHLPDENARPHFTRDVLYVYGEYDGEPLHIFVNHWPSRRGGEEASAPFRALAAGVCKAKIDSITKKNPDAKIVVMGDLNDDPVSPSITQVLKATGTVDKVKRGGLYNPWTLMFNSGIGTLAYNDAWNLFDQIIISSAWLDKKQNGFFFKDARIFRKDFMINQNGHFRGYPKRTFDGNKYIGGYSDHLPTYIVLLKKASIK